MKRYLLILLLLAMTTQAQQVFLTGKVMDAAGNALQGVAVTLSKMKLSAVSGANGVYRINTSPVMRRSSPSGPINEFEIAGGVLYLTLDSQTPVLVAAYNAQGRQSSVLAHGLYSSGNHAIALAQALPRQVGILSVKIGGNRTFFRFVNVGHFSVVHPTTAPIPAESKRAKISAVAVLDTLTAVSGAHSINLFVYAYTDTMDFWIDASDPYTEYRQQCMHRINYYRSLVGEKMLTRNLTKEACVDSQCQSDAASGAAHGAFGKCGESAQDECPGWGSLSSIGIGCLQQMWDEGPPPAGTPCAGGTACYQQHGHYINMTGSYSSMACGFYVGAAGKVQAIQNFWR